MPFALSLSSFSPALLRCRLIFLHATSDLKTDTTLLARVTTDPKQFLGDTRRHSWTHWLLPLGPSVLRDAPTGYRASSSRIVMLQARPSGSLASSSERDWRGEAARRKGSLRYVALTGGMKARSQLMN